MSLKLFCEIWEEREHISEISGKTLIYPPNRQWHWQFSHTLPVSIYGRWREEKFNIVLMLPDEHTFYEHFTEDDMEKEMYLDYKDKWDELFELRDELKRKYHAEKLK